MEQTGDGKPPSISTAPFKVISPQSYGMLGYTHLEWVHQPRKALIIEKIRDPDARHYLILASQYLFHDHHFAVYVEDYVKKELKNYAFLNTFINCDESMVDFVLAFGGDGTLLHISKLFPCNCPPIVPFAMGSLGFLTPFLADDYQSATDDLIRGFFFLTSRTRLLCSIYRQKVLTETVQAMNDIVFLSSKNGTVCAIDCFIDDEYFTTVFGDGLITASSTGSTAYNLSAGGVIVHPSVSTLLWTPVCPHALNAHPLVFPDSIQLEMQIADSARGNDPYTVNFDSYKTTIAKGDQIVIRISPYPVPTVCQKEPMTDWLNSISTVLKWNQPMRNQITNKEDEVVSDKYYVCVDD